MNSVQMHLALTHVPVILSLTGLAMLILTLLVKNPTLTKTSYIIIAIAGIAALPVFFSGEGAEEAVEHIPGMSEGIIEKHETVAKLAMISIAAAGVLALGALFSSRWLSLSRALRFLVLALAITSGGLMFQTARLGGQIRHTEITKGIAVQNTNETTGENEKQDHDD
jgi:hypothetical protein